MNEIGIDISNYRVKHFSEFYRKEIDIAITVCDNAIKVCPIFPGAKMNLHNTFIDPTDAKGIEEEILNDFRGVRNQIKDWIDKKFINNHCSN